MKYLFAIGLIFIIVQLLLFSCGLLPPQTYMVKFSIPRKSNDQSISSIYISLDSNAYKSINSTAINPNGVDVSYIIFFEDGSFKAPISFDQTLYRLYRFYNKEKVESLYSPKEDWGRYKTDRNAIEFEVGLCEYTPSCKFRLKSGVFDIINDSTLDVDPYKKDNSYIFGKSTVIFHKIDSIDLNFIDPSNAWHNKRDAKNKK